MVGIKEFQERQRRKKGGRGSTTKHMHQWGDRLEVVVLFRQRRSSGLVELLLVLRHEVLVDLDLGRGERGRGDELEVRVADELAREPEERSLKVVVRLGRNLKVLQVLLAVERDGARLDLSLLQTSGAAGPKSVISPVFSLRAQLKRRRGATRTLTSTLLPQRTMGMFSQTRSRSRCQLGTFLYVILDVTSNMMIPHWPYFHAGQAISVEQQRKEPSETNLDVVTVAETTELFLTGRVPDVEADRAKVGVEGERVDLDTKGGCSGATSGQSIPSNALMDKMFCETHRCTSSQTLPAR